MYSLGFHQCFLKTTKQMSQAKMPFLHQVIPYMDSWTISLDEFHVNPDLNPTVHIAAGHGYVIVDKFYGMTDELHDFRIAMCKYSHYVLLSGNLLDCK